MDRKQADSDGGKGTGRAGSEEKGENKTHGHKQQCGAVRGQAGVEVGNNGKRTRISWDFTTQDGSAGQLLAFSSIFHSEDNCSTPGAPARPTHPANELVGPTACFCVACQLTS